MSTDLQKLAQKFDSIFDFVLGVLDRMEGAEARVAALEEVQQQPETPTYSEALNSRPQDNSRLEKLKFFSSEEERKKLLSQVCFTHPSVSSDSPQSCEHVKGILTSLLKISGSEMDSNLHVQKTKKTDTLVVQKNKLRRTSEYAIKDLYFNDNLTPYNYSMLKTPKQEKERLRTSNKPYFETINSFKGKVFVRKQKDTSNQIAVHIRSPTHLQSFPMSYLHVNAASMSDEAPYHKKIATHV